MEILGKSRGGGGNKDPWIEVLAEAAIKDMPRDIYAFRVSQLAYIKSLSPYISVLKVDGSPEILIDLPFAKLSARIYRPDDDVIDLKDKTLFFKSQVDRDTFIRDKFNRAADKDKYPFIAAISIKAYVREPGRQEFVLATINGADIRVEDIDESGSVVEKGTRTITFKTYDSKGGPFGQGQFMIEGTQDEFMRICEMAHKAGERTVDLVGWSAQKQSVKKLISGMKL